MQSQEGFTMTVDANFKEEIGWELSDVLCNKAQEGLEIWEEQTGIKLSDFDYPIVDPDVPTKVSDKLLSAATKEFLKMYPNTTEDTYEVDVKEYVTQNYSSDFMAQQIDHYEDKEKMRESLVEDIALFTSWREPYNQVGRAYWFECAQKVTDFRELSRFKNGDIDAFVSEYAPDWEEVLDQIKKNS